MGVWLVLAGLAIAGADAGLTVIAWRRRAALSAVAGVAGVGTGLAAAVSAGGGSHAQILLGVALVLGGFGIALFVLGQVVQRLLEQTPDGEVDVVPLAAAGADVPGPAGKTRRPDDADQLEPSRGVSADRARERTR